MVNVFIMNVCKQIFISGRVQGVFFRESTRNFASTLKLVGYVRNRRDGRVEVLVAGEEEAVYSLIKWLKIGPKLAKVSTIDVVDCHLDLAQEQQSGQFKIATTK